MHFHNADCIKAEIIWTLKSVLGGFSIRVNDDLNETLSAMFPNSKIAANFSMARTKAMYAINHGTEPYFKSLLLSSIDTSDIHVYSFDESLNEVTQTCEINLYVRYWDVACSQVKMRYFGSSFMGHGTYTDILQHFDEVTKDLNPAHLCQISMDRPNVNVEFYRKFAQERKDENYHSLMDIGSCGLHVISKNLGTGVDDSQWGIKRLMKEAYKLFHDTPARRDDYKSITGSSAYPFSLCSSQ